jgi:hypothetical protein
VGPTAGLAAAVDIAPAAALARGLVAGRTTELLLDSSSEVPCRGATGAAGLLPKRRLRSHASLSPVDGDSLAMADIV